MKTKQLFLFTSLLLCLLAQPARAQLYWDSNTSTPGAGDTPTGTWDVDAFWSSDSTGASSTTTWTDGNIAVFAAGTDATNGYTVTVSGTPTATGINFEEGTVTVAGSTLNLSGAAIIDVATNHSARINSIIGGGAIALTKNGGGTLTLGANNTFSSGIVVNSGVLSFTTETSSTAGSANPLGAYPAAATPAYITLNAGTTLRSIKVGTAAGTSSYILANRGIAISGGVFLEMTDATANTALLASSVISGTDGITKVGGGTILLTAVNTYTGDTTIKAGGLGVNGTAKFGDGTGTLVLDGGDVYSSATRTFANAIANPILIKTNVTIHAYNNSFTTGTRTLDFKSTNIVATGGTLTLTNHGSAGTLFIFQFNTMGGLQFARPINVGPGCRFDLWNDDQINDAVFSGNISGVGSMQYTSFGTGTGGKTIVTGFNTYTGTNSFNGGYVGFGSDTLPASGAITSGPVGTGTIFVKNDPIVGVFAQGAARTVRNPISFVTVDNFRVVGTNDLTLGGAVTLNSSNITFTVDNTGLTVFSGAIGGGTSGKTLTKEGLGTVVFSGANTYIIPTTVANGTLIVNNSTGSGTGTGAVTANANTTLGGTGIISGAVSVNGNLSPGPGAGTLTMSGGLNLSGGTYIWELATNGTNAGSFDQIALTGGTLALGGSSTLSINFTNAATAPNASNPFWQTSHSWNIVSLSGAATNSGGSNFVTLQNASYSAGNFSTATNANGSIVLTFTSSSAPAPTFNGTITGAGTANVGLSWSAINGTTYQVRYKNDLNDPSWTPLSTVTAAGSTASYTDTTAGSASKRFYQLLVQ